MGYLFAVVVGYLLGSSNMAYYLSKLKNIDLKKRGSGNLGTSNAWTELGWKSSVLVFLHDAGKAALAVLLTRWIFSDALYADCIAGVCAVLGHVFPFYLKFKGGKGHAAYIGMAFALNWWVALIVTPFCIAAWLITDYMVGLVFATIALFPILSFCVGQWQIGLFSLVATAIVFYRHTENVKRIINGTEGRFRAGFLGKDKKEAQAPDENGESRENEE